jgi:hypothetical protein
LGRRVVVGNPPADDLLVEREGLQRDVEAAAVLVREDEPAFVENALVATTDEAEPDYPHMGPTKKSN